MKNEFFPGWAEKHVPAPFSDRPYYGMSHRGEAGASELYEMSPEPLTPQQRLGAQEDRERRERERLERSFR